MAIFNPRLMTLNAGAATRLATNTPAPGPSAAPVVSWRVDSVGRLARIWRISCVEPSG